MENTNRNIVSRGSFTTFKWSEEFACFVVNGVLTPIPLSVVDVGSENQEERVPSVTEGSRRRRTMEGNEKLKFRLFKYPNAIEEYLLETYQIETCGIERCHVSVHEDNGKWKVRVHALAQTEHVVMPLLQDPYPLVFHKKYELSLEERLTGWTMERRQRSTGKEDSFFYHQGRQFRSFVETIVFILYSTHPKDLKLINSN